MTWVRRLAAIVPALALVSPPATAATVRPPARTSLAGVTTFRASAPSVTTVWLPRAVDLRTPFGSSPDLDVRGGGRVVVLALVGADAATRGTTVVGGRFPDRTAPVEFLLTAPQYPAIGGGTFENLKTFGDTARIPAGAYRAYVVPDGKAADVTLRLRGLRGATTVVPRQRADAAVSPAALVPGAHQALVATTERALRGPGLAIQALWLDTQAYAATQVVMCHYVPPDGTPPMPGCPHGEKHVVVNDRVPTAARDGKLFLQAYAGLPGGRHALSTTYLSESVATDSAFLTFWLRY